MHIADGVLSGPSGLAVLGAGFALSAAGTALGLRRLDYERMPRVALLSSAFFVASFIHVPVGLTSVHLVLNGLIGLILGWTSFPAILVGLLLHLTFNFGGVTTLGINTLTMALPAVVCHYAFRRAVRTEGGPWAFVAGFAAGALGIVLSGLLVGGALMLGQAEYAGLGKLVMVANLPIALVEGLVTGSTVVFLRRVCPQLLHASLLLDPHAEVSHA